MKQMSGNLFNSEGQRKYLTNDERMAFLHAAESADRETRTLCSVLAFTGCRLSEALALTADRIDLANSTITFETLKKRRKGVFRSVPVPPEVLDALDLVHGIRSTQRSRSHGRGVYLWTWSRTTAWRKVKAVMEEAKLSEGPQATPKGLRHSFGVQGVTKGVPLNLVQRWLGHAQLSTTAIYAEATGEEERHIANRMWGKSSGG
jgi:integrase